MEVVQSSEECMKIIECNEEASEYVKKDLFNFGDWTNSEWTTTWQQGTITKYTDKITFYNSSNYASNYLSQYPIDWTKDFLLEMRAYLPSTSAGYHHLGLHTVESWNQDIIFETNWENRNYFYCTVFGSRNWTWSYNPWTVNYFIKKEWNTLTMGWDGVVKYTGTVSLSRQYYLYESAYRDTVTIYTAKLTYL